MEYAVEARLAAALAVNGHGHDMTLVAEHPIIGTVVEVLLALSVKVPVTENDDGE